MTIPGPVKTLEIGVRRLLDLRWPDRQRSGLPAGLVLQVHPSAWNMLLADPGGGWQMAAQGMTPEEFLSARFGVPVERARSLPRRTWRLVIVSEDVLITGRL